MAAVGWYVCFDGHAVKEMGFHSTASATAALMALRGHIAWETFSIGRFASEGSDLFLSHGNDTRLSHGNDTRPEKTCH